MEEAEDDDAALGFRKPVELEKHLGDARQKAEILCQRLDITDESVCKAVMDAAGGTMWARTAPGGSGQLEAWASPRSRNPGNRTSTVQSIRAIDTSSGPLRVYKMSRRPLLWSRGSPIFSYIL
jgi:hypothetical protein